MIDRVVVELLSDAELKEANTKHPKYFASDHECYAVIKEELEEAEEELNKVKAGIDVMWNMVKLDRDIEDALIDIKNYAYLLIAEAIQVYAMCEKGLRTHEFKRVIDKMREER